MTRIRITLAEACFRLARRVFALGRSLDDLGFKLVPPDPVTIAKPWRQP